jgi:hypothetical protein
MFIDDQYDRLGWRLAVPEEAAPHSLVVNEVRDAKNGNALEWNAYGSEEGCYVESMVDNVGTEEKPRLRITEPKWVPHDGLDEYLRTRQR